MGYQQFQGCFELGFSLLAYSNFPMAKKISHSKQFRETSK
jgi:hypothetical protein